MNTRVIARQGELAVFENLPKAQWINGEAETKESYDIFWESIKIDVKTTTHPAPSTEKAFQFFDSSAPKKLNTVFVFVALYNNKTWFWVESAMGTQRGFYRKITDAITSKQLPNAIKECYEKLNKQNPN